MLCFFQGFIWDKLAGSFLRKKEQETRYFVDYYCARESSLP